MHAAEVPFAADIEDEGASIEIVRAKRYRENGATYAVATDSERRRVYELGSAPPGLALNFEAKFDA